MASVVKARRVNWIKGLVLLILLSVEGLAQAEGMVELTQEVSVSASSPSQARRQGFERVILKTSEKYIQDIIGQQKFDHNKGVIRKKIIKNSGKYILSLKSSKPKWVGRGYSLSVTLKMSLKNLQEMLLEQGLLYKMEGALRVIPMISFQDRVNIRTYKWWAPEIATDIGFMMAQSKYFTTRLRHEMWERGFFSLSPTGSDYRNMMPSAFMSGNLRTKDYLLVGKYFNSQIVVRGFVRYTKSKEKTDVFQLDIKLVALHSGNGRVVGEVIRTYETDSGSFQSTVKRKMSEVVGRVTKDLTVQVHDVWKRGTFGANLLRLVVNGVKGPLSYLQLMHLKEILISQVRNIRLLKERFFDQERVVFEMDVTGDTRQIAQTLKKTPFQPFQVRVSKVTSNSIELSVW